MTRTPPPGLTDRQLEVWRLLDRGYGVRTIARLLGISTTAVRYRIDAIERKAQRTSEEESAA